MKYIKIITVFLITIIILLSTSCQSILSVIYNVDLHAKVYDKRNVVDSINTRYLKKAEIGYVMLYRTNKYVISVDSSYLGDHTVYFFDSLGYKYKTNSTCSASNSIIEEIKANQSCSIVDSNNLIQSCLIGLKTVKGEDYVYEENKLAKYNIIMAWSTYWTGPQKKQVKRLINSLPMDSTFFYFINMDLIEEDSLSIYKNYMFKTNQ